MKQKNIYFYSILILVLAMMTGPGINGQDRTLEKDFRWSRAVQGQAQFTFTNYDCNLTIHTWDRPEIEYLMSVTATLKSEEDAGKLRNAIEGMDFSESVGGLQFDNRFWTSRKSIRGRKTMNLKKEGTIRYSEFRMKGEMWIPRDCRLALQSRYSEIEAGDLDGPLTLDLYNDRFYGGGVNNRLDLKAKYSNLELKDLKDVQADLYNTDLEAGNAGDLKIQSKYSTIRLKDAGRADIQAYNDKYSFDRTGDIRFVDKYSDLKAERTGDLELDCYNSTLTVQKAGDLSVISKYGRYRIGTMNGLQIHTGYNDSYEIDKLSSLDIDISKYGEFRIGYLERSLILKEGYSDKISVSGTGSLEEMRLNGKYIEADVALDENLNYRFQANVRYAHFDLPEESLIVSKKIQEGASLEMEAVRGKASEGMPAFFVNGYDLHLTLREKR
jgi:hypothetical protein